MVVVMMMVMVKKKKTQPFKLLVYGNYLMNIFWLKKMNQQIKIYPYMGLNKLRGLKV
jgi:hypothetical protein